MGSGRPSTLDTRISCCLLPHTFLEIFFPWRLAARKNLSNITKGPGPGVRQEGWLGASFVYTGGALWAGKNESRKRNILCRDRRRAARLTAEGLAFAAKLQTSWRRSHVLPTCTSRFKQRLLAFLPASHELANGGAKP
jgi:hypothetical protein